MHVINFMQKSNGSIQTKIEKMIDICTLAFFRNMAQNLILLKMLFYEART